MRTPHLYAELIKAWADGAEIEAYQGGNSWKYVPTPVWSLGTTYRIKPEPKPDIVRWCWSNTSMGWDTPNPEYGSGRPADFKLIFDGETKKLKKVELL